MHYYNRNLLCPDPLRSQFSAPLLLTIYSSVPAPIYITSEDISTCQGVMLPKNRLKPQTRMERTDAGHTRLIFCTSPAGIVSRVSHHSRAPHRVSMVHIRPCVRWVSVVELQYNWWQLGFSPRGSHQSLGDPWTRERLGATAPSALPRPDYGLQRVDLSPTG